MTSLNGERYADIGYHGEEDAEMQEVIATQLRAAHASVERVRAENARLRNAIRWIRDYSPLPLAVLAKANEALISSRPMTTEEVEAAEQIEAEDAPRCPNCGFTMDGIGPDGARFCTLSCDVGE